MTKWKLHYQISKTIEPIAWSKWSTAQDENSVILKDSEVDTLDLIPLELISTMSFEGVF